ncbi:hypothetical protein [Tsukamurella soli]|uniref:Uncharacterized protein n=1 Tax=Tsukamurella soli TaxID=644556 RepID=A0ABP8KA62_9ACTN
MNTTATSTTTPGDRPGRRALDGVLQGGCTGAQRSPLHLVADSLDEHGLSATLTASGQLQLRTGTARFSAHVVQAGGGTAIEVRAHREGRRSLLGCVSDPEAAAHLLIGFASLAGAWQFAAEVFDRLILRGDVPALAAVPMTNTVFARLGSRTYAEIEVDEAEPCLDQPALAQVTTFIAARPIDDEWRFERLADRRFDIVGRIAGGTHPDPDSVLDILDVHGRRAADWERLH